MQHAPQYKFAGTGMDLPLLQWLERYTFPTEATFASAERARDVYAKTVARCVAAGTTTSVYFATIHRHSSVILAETTSGVGQRAYVGKVSMNRNSPADLCEGDEAAAEEEAFIKHVLDMGNGLVTPIVTPRFVPSCTGELMRALGALADKYNVPIQSHISENKDEIAWVAALHPECKSYADVYKQHGLWNKQTIMAHGCHLTEDEVKLCKEDAVGISHCPNSNFSLCSGWLDVRRLIDAGVKVGLGTDVAGGYSSSMLDAMRQAIIASTVSKITKDEKDGYAASAARTTHRARSLTLAPQQHAPLLRRRLPPRHGRRRAAAQHGAQDRPLPGRHGL